MHNIFVFPHNRIHNRLGKHWFVDFIVTMLSVANNINHNILEMRVLLFSRISRCFISSKIAPNIFSLYILYLMKRISIFCSYFAYICHSFWVIGINMEYWSINNSSNICTIWGGPRVPWIGCKSNLVISN